MFEHTWTWPNFTCGQLDQIWLEARWMILSNVRTGFNFLISLLVNFLSGREASWFFNLTKQMQRNKIHQVICVYIRSYIAWVQIRLSFIENIINSLHIKLSFINIGYVLLFVLIHSEMLYFGDHNQFNYGQYQSDIKNIFENTIYIYIYIFCIALCRHILPFLLSLHLDLKQNKYFKRCVLW